MKKKILSNALKRDVINNLKVNLGEDFTPIKILGSGAYSVAILIEDKMGNQLVYKCDVELQSRIKLLKTKIEKIKKFNKPESLKQLKKELLNLNHSIQLNDTLAETLQNKCRSAKVPIFLPQSKIFVDFTIEEFAGEVVSPELLKEKQDQFTTDLAKFYAKLHSGVNMQPQSEPLYKQLIKKLPQIIKSYKYVLPDDTLRSINQAYKKLQTMNNDDEIQTTIHGDLRRLNLCFDGKTQRLAVIDWGFAKVGNIYSDFIPVSVASQQLTNEFIQQIVQKYNQISEHKINPEKLNCLRFLRIVEEYGKIALCANLRNDDFRTFALDRIMDAHEEFINASEQEK